MLKQIGIALGLGLLPACATSFTGSAHIQGGRAGCETKCSAQGLVMSGLVFLGEYSTACVCSVRSANPAGPVSQQDLHSAVAAIGGAAAGVIMEKKSQELTRNQTIPY